MRNLQTKTYRICLVALVIWGLTQGTQLAEGQSQSIQVVKTWPRYGQVLTSFQELTITLEFNRDMDPDIQENFILDQRGKLDENGDLIVIDGEFIWVNPRTMQFKLREPLKPHSTYQASLFSIRTQNGEESEDVPFRLVFRTGPGEK